MNSSELVSIDQGLATLRITVDAQRAAEAVRHTVRSLTARVNIPGFRKGKAPRAIVERYIGIDAIYEQAIQSFLPEAYRQAVKDTGITPLSEPEFEGLGDAQLESGNDVVFTAKVWIKPDVELMDYSTIKLRREQREITDDDVNGVLEDLREDNSEYVPVDRTTVQEDDLVNLDLEGYVDGQKSDAASVSDFEIVVGKGQIIEGLDERIAGMKLNEPSDVELTLPEEFHNVELAGKTVTFRVTVKSIKEKQVPELNDDFAKQVADVDSLEQLKDRVKHQLIHQELDRAIRELGLEALRRIVEGSKVSEHLLPMERTLDQMVSEVRSRVEQQGFAWDYYLNARNITEEQLREELRESAASRVRRKLVTEEIARRENLIPTERDVSLTALSLIRNAEHLSRETLKEIITDPDVRASAFELALDAGVVRFLGGHCDEDPDSATCGYDHSHDDEHEHDHEHGDDHEHDHGDDQDHDAVEAADAGHSVDAADAADAAVAAGSSGSAEPSDGDEHEPEAAEQE